MRFRDHEPRAGYGRDGVSRLRRQEPVRYRRSQDAAHRRLSSSPACGSGGPRQRWRGPTPLPSRKKSSWRVPV